MLGPHTVRSLLRECTFQAELRKGSAFSLGKVGWTGLMMLLMFGKLVYFELSNLPKQSDAKSIGTETPGNSFESRVPHFREWARKLSSCCAEYGPEEHVRAAGRKVKEV
jgi:hypothetical protein